MESMTLSRFVISVVLQYHVSTCEIQFASDVYACGWRNGSPRFGEPLHVASRFGLRVFPSPPHPTTVSTNFRCLQLWRVLKPFVRYARLYSSCLKEFYGCKNSGINITSVVDQQ
jgi:hypothetical protein